MASSNTHFNSLSSRKAELEERLMQLDCSLAPVSLSQSTSTKGVTSHVQFHWDFVLKEVNWLSEDFHKERNRHAANAKKCTKGLEVYLKTVEVRKARRDKEEQTNLHRIASKISRDVKKFWFKVDKVIAFQQKIEADEIRQKAMDQHLRYLVNLTEGYASKVARNLIADNKSSSQPPTESVKSFSGKEDEMEDTHQVEDGDNDEELEAYEPDDEEDEADNESTLLEQEAFEAREKAGDDAIEEEEDEIAALEREGAMSVEELRALYAGERDETEEEEEEEDDEQEEEANEEEERVLDSNVDGENVARDDEFEGNGNGEREDDDEDSFAPTDDDQDMDNESTFLEQEAFERGQNGNEQDENEIDLLKREGEMSLEELRALYSNVHGSPFSDGSIEEMDEEVSSEEVNGEVPDAALPSQHEEVDDNDEELEAYEPDDEEDEADNESTLLEQEAFEAREKAGDDAIEEEEDEIAALEREGAMSVEELRALYAGERDETEEEEEEEDEGWREGEEQEVEEKKNSPILTRKRDRRSLENDSGTTESEDVDEEDNRRDDNRQKPSRRNGRQRQRSKSIANESSLMEDNEVPFILSKSLLLREYQLYGMRWLVSLHNQRLNGILADEMGLGKTIQTIALLAHLVVQKGLWGPHLIIAPTSCVVNWESEFKKFCPSLKILPYFGSTKARKQLRTGWSKLNAFHICITSYQLVVQDASAFARKKWYYMILDEAHNIKNFKSKRWQTLLKFNSHRRLLLTGTPIQNNLMELWSLMHFLMPHVFASRKEFAYWFSNPLESAVEGAKQANADIVNKLHGIIRPFILRRLKSEVAQQLPKKYEHILYCKMSKRQQLLYEEFMLRSSTRSNLSGGSYLGMMNILMQLRKICDHPDLLEPRLIASPFIQSEGLAIPSLVVATGKMQQWLEDSVQFNHRNNICFWDDVSIEKSFQPSTLLDRVDRDEQGGGKGNKSKIPSTKMTATANSRSSSWEQGLLHLLHQQKREETEGNHKRNMQISKERVGRSSLSSQLIRTTWLALESKLNCTNNAVRLNPLRFILIWSRELQEEISWATESLAFVLPRVVSCGPIPARRYRQVRDKLLYSFDNLTHRKALALSQSPAAMDSRLIFPEKKMIQYDSGKLRNLALLLREKKKGGHKCLIFTQMSKMLDILEVFLNMNDMSFVRLDGSTSIDMRQKLMDRFNVDPKLFCFILSTRSGGLGINLTGADTVIFYDTDWNPAMDAQAQDRAHRIGQTRDVHIYRMVVEGTVEENILLKAQQRKQLDNLVMNEGKFSETSLISLRTLQNIFEIDVNAVSLTGATAADTSNLANENKEEDSNQDMERAMAMLEDEEDYRAMKLVKFEVENSLDDSLDDALKLAAETSPGHDQTASTSNNGARKASKARDRKKDGSSMNNEESEEEGDDDDRSTSSSQEIGKEEAKSMITASTSNAASADAELQELDAQLDSQLDSGQNPLLLEAALSSIDRYAVRYHSVFEPYCSPFFVPEQTKLAQLVSSEDADRQKLEMFDNDKQREEIQQLNNGEILLTTDANMLTNHYRAWYKKQRCRRKFHRHLRSLTGTCWESHYDEDGIPFWFNHDNGEYSYTTPNILLTNEQYSSALQRRYNGLPLSIMVKIFSFLSGYPDRMRLSTVCARWYEAATHESFIKRVFPIETGIREIGKENGIVLDSNTFPTLAEAIKHANPGDTISLYRGHYWEPGLVIPIPLKFVCQNSESERALIELTKSIQILPSARSCLFYGLSFRPSDYNSCFQLLDVDGSRVTVGFCNFEQHSEGSASVLLRNGTGLFHGCNFYRGRYGIEATVSSVGIDQSSIVNSHCALFLDRCLCVISDSVISSNESKFRRVKGALSVSHSDLRENADIEIEGSSDKEEVIIIHCLC